MIGIFQFQIQKFTNLDWNIQILNLNMLILQFAGGRSHSMDGPRPILKHISPRPILKHFATLIHILADPIHHFWSFFGRYFPSIIIGHFSIDLGGVCPNQSLTAH